MPQCLMCSINQSIRIYVHPMTVLLKIVNNSMTALLKSLSVLLESIDIAWNVNRTTGKEVRPWPGFYSPALQSFLHLAGFIAVLFLKRTIFPSTHVFTRKY